MECNNVHECKKSSYPCKHACWCTIYSVNYDVKFSIYCIWWASAHSGFIPFIWRGLRLICALSTFNSFQTGLIKSLCMPFRRASSPCAWTRPCLESQMSCSGVGRRCRCYTAEAAAGTVETAGLTRLYRWGERIHWFDKTVQVRGTNP